MIGHLIDSVKKDQSGILFGYNLNIGERLAIHFDYPYYESITVYGYRYVIEIESHSCHISIFINNTTILNASPIKSSVNIFRKFYEL